ncbi:hypothetical protein GOODEAATRI_032882, partial [Goodea atripinnis]
ISQSIFTVHFGTFPGVKSGNNISSPRPALSLGNSSVTGGRAVPAGTHIISNVYNGNSCGQTQHCVQSLRRLPGANHRLSGSLLTEQEGTRKHPGGFETSKKGSWIVVFQRAAASMFSWVKQEQGGRNKEGEMYQTVTEGLQILYTKKLLPLEETYLFHDFHSPALEGADFQSKPMVLLVGQYSTGKTTFIR